MRLANGTLAPGWNGPALERFLRNCRFNPGTGCVLWTGGTTAGRGHSARYGAFWYEGRRWAAHRWSSRFIHGHVIDGLQVGHFCNETTWLDAPDTLCVEHVRPETAEVNRALQTLHLRAVQQSVEQRRFWVHAQVGIHEAPPVSHACFSAVPFYEEPAWLRGVPIEQPFERKVACLA